MKPGHNTSPRCWNHIAQNWPAESERNPLLGNHKRQVYRRLIERWTSGTAPARVLKTDLFAEAFNNEEFLSALPWQDRIIGIDISTVVLQSARRRRGIGPLFGYVACDVSSLPFRDGSFDLVISDSTLDHFEHVSTIHTGLAQLARVLCSGGRLIVSLDNPVNLTYPPRWLVRLWMRMGLAPYYVGVTLSAAGLDAALKAQGLSVMRRTTILHYPHPDGLVRLCERGARTVRLDGLMRRFFAATEQLEGTRLRYLTGRYIAMDAIKH